MVMESLLLAHCLSSEVLTIVLTSCSYTSHAKPGSPIFFNCPNPSHFIGYHFLQNNCWPHLPFSFGNRLSMHMCQEKRFGWRASGQLLKEASQISQIPMLPASCESPGDVVMWDAELISRSSEWRVGCLIYLLQGSLFWKNCKWQGLLIHPSLCFLLST